MLSIAHRLVAILLTAAPTPAEPAILESPLHPVVAVDSHDSVDLALVGDAVIARHSGDGFAFGLLGPNGFERAKDLANGIASCAREEHLQLAGRFPEAAWMVKGLNPWAACSVNVGEVFQWDGRRWKMKDLIDGLQVLVAPWTRGSGLMVVVPHGDGPPWGYEIRLVGAAAGLAAPKPQKAVRSRRAEHPCRTKVDWPTRLLTGKDGSVLVVGSHCKQQEEPEDRRKSPTADFAVEYFAPNVRQSQIITIPIPARKEEDLVFFGPEPGNFWAGGGPKGSQSRLARFNGQSWESTQGPPGNLISFGVDDSGVIWAISQLNHTNVLWRAPSGEKDFVKVPVPDKAGALKSIVVRGNGDAWLVTERGVFSTLSTPKPWRWQNHQCTSADQEREARDARVRDGFISRHPGKSEPRSESRPNREGRSHPEDDFLRNILDSQ
jgi:hypothetical protein